MALSFQSIPGLIQQGPGYERHCALNSTKMLLQSSVSQTSTVQPFLIRVPGRSMKEIKVGCLLEAEVSSPHLSNSGPGYSIY